MDLSLLRNILLPTLLCMVTAQSVDAIELKVEGNLKRILTPGGQERFTCRINEGLMFIFKNDISWVHRSLVSNTEQILTTQSVLHYDASPDKYEIEFVAKTDQGSDIQYLLATLTVKNVEAGDDGQYICRNIEKSNSMATDSQPVDVSITHDVQKVSLIIHDRKPVTGTERIELEEGEYPVRCDAKDFSPDVDIKIAIGGVPVNGISKVTQIDNALSSAANSRRYSAMAGASRLMLSSEDSGKTLSCTASATFQGARSSTASVILTVLSDRGDVERSELSLRPPLPALRGLRMLIASFHCNAGQAERNNPGSAQRIVLVKISYSNHSLRTSHVPRYSSSLRLFFSI
ncbi:uncharacterized protein LOC112564960 isoform X2 [Pomacea canaliculata]|uniref:uncharacterized protein LOC112564960 isoform X2 n=1 Tax=Pomacea canaliculata TaxID=400727 RepID=UPI000D732B07|nr:uncharacterized protein LOC112564960 isoform X2 [Pomacea canaliculata]